MNSKLFHFAILNFLIFSHCASPTSRAIAHPLADAARAQIGQTVEYNPAYLKISYPHGDVPIEYGVCTDVLIRALRKAWGIDLQALVHEDMTRHFSHYPKLWGLTSTDRNIDHRRVPNLQTYFKRAGYQLPISSDPNDYRAGDIVTVMVPPRLPHIMIVSNKKTFAGVPYVMHNIGRGTREENRLFDFEMTGHYRIEKK